MHVMSGFGNGPVKAGEIFNIGESRVYESGFSIKDYSRGFPDNPVSIGVILGPQDHLFTKESLDEFFSSTYVLTNQSDRQGLRFSGNKIPTKTGNHDIDFFLKIVGIIILVPFILLALSALGITG